MQVEEEAQVSDVSSPQRILVDPQSRSLTHKVMMLLLPHRSNLGLKPLKARLNRERWSTCGVMAMGMKLGRCSRWRNQTM